MAPTLRVASLLLLLLVVNVYSYGRSSTYRRPRAGVVVSCSASEPALSSSKQYTVGEPFVDEPQTMSAVCSQAALGVSRVITQNLAAIREQRSEALKFYEVVIPIPVTGGTELDDFPGGIKQKYMTLLPLIRYILQLLSFQDQVVNSSQFFGSCGREDFVGYWRDDEKFVDLITLPTAETIRDMQSMQGPGTFIIINNQFFLNPMSSKSSKDFLQALDYAYILQPLLINADGLAIKGLLYRQFPNKYVICRRNEGSSSSGSGSNYFVLAVSDTYPSRAEIEEVFRSDSKTRDKDMSFFKRLMTQVPSF